MTMRTMLGSGMVAVGFAVLLAASPVGMNAGQATGRVDIDNDDLSGVVTSTNGPEPGVWVIAETTDLPTKCLFSSPAHTAPSQGFYRRSMGVTSTVLLQRNSDGFISPELIILLSSVAEMIDTSGGNFETNLSNSWRQQLSLYSK